MKHGWPKIEPLGAGNVEAASLPTANVKRTSLLDGPCTGLSAEAGPLDNQVTTLFVIGGASAGLKHQLTKTRTSIGQAGGGADIEINDGQASPIHCVLAATKNQDMVRLYDLGSENGTYVNSERVQITNLVHCSEFRVGSTVFLVTIVSKHSMEAA